MAELRQCSELVTNFRIRIGEPTPGTFGTVHYDGINKSINEIIAILNQAQHHVTWMCYSANQALLETTVYLEVLSGVSRYTLPEDFLGPVAVFHRTYGQAYEVERANLFEIRRSTRSERYDYRYRFYEIRENVPIISARGVINTDHAVQITDTGLESVRVGDTAYNLTDHSQGVINAVYPAINAISVEALNNGGANVWQKGDIYQIDMAEQTRDAIDFWPKVTKEDSEEVYKGDPTFQLTEDSVVFRVAADVSEVPTAFEDDERVILRILQGSDVVGEGARENLSTNYNVFYFPHFIQLREDVDYTVTVERADGGSIAIDEIRVDAKIEPESVDVRYAKLPRPMTKLEDYCEVPSWALEAVYAYAHIIAQKKMSRNPNADRGLVAEFNTAIQDVKDFLYKRDERGPHQLPMLGGRRNTGNPYPGNYSVALVDPHDIF